MSPILWVAIAFFLLTAGAAVYFLFFQQKPSRQVANPSGRDGFVARNKQMGWRDAEDKLGHAIREGEAESVLDYMRRGLDKGKPNPQPQAADPPQFKD